MHVPLLVFAMLLAAVPVAAQEDAEGSKDHPMFSRMPGYYIDMYDAQDFGAHEFELDPAIKVEGRYWSIKYRLKEGAKKYGPLRGHDGKQPICCRQGKCMNYAEFDIMPEVRSSQRRVSCVSFRSLMVRSHRNKWTGDDAPIYCPGAESTQRAGNDTRTNRRRSGMG
jgi:hypothetical protein